MWPSAVKAAVPDLRWGRAVWPLTTIHWLPLQDGSSLKWHHYSPRVTWPRDPRTWACCCCPLRVMISSTWWVGDDGWGLRPVTALNQSPMDFSPEKPRLQVWEAGSQFLSWSGCWWQGEADVDYRPCLALGTYDSLISGWPSVPLVTARSHTRICLDFQLLPVQPLVL